MIVQNSFYAWLLAARPKTLSAALAPVAIATAFAYQQGAAAWLPALLCILFASVMQIASNFINDLYDFQQGTDRADRLGPERACAQGWISVKSMRIGIGITLVIACTIGLCLLPYGGLPLLLIGVACVLFAFLYTTLLSRIGLGDILVWVCFGIVPVCTTFYVQTGYISWPVLLASAGCGLCIDTLLILNNYRDRYTDAAVHKRTLIVLFGGSFGSYFYLYVGLAAYVLIALCSYWLSWPMVVIPLLYLPAHYQAWRMMVRIQQGHQLNSILGITSRNILLFALCTVLAALSSGAMS